MREWIRATPTHRCSVCDGTKLCGWTSDGRVRACLRNFYEPGANVVEEELGTTAYYFDDTSDAQRWQAKQDRKQPIPLGLDPQRIHEIYSKAFELQRLSKAHREAFRARGLTDDQIDLAGYRSMLPGNHSGMLRVLDTMFGRDDLALVPGFYVEGKSIKMMSTPGIWIPVRDAQGRIQAIRVRPDKPVDDDRKYVWFSSAHKGGASPRAPAHAPILGAPGAVIGVTEGELKADIATALSGNYWISIPGATCVSSSLPLLEHLGASRVRLAWDADKSEDRGLDDSGRQKRNGVISGLEHAMHVYRETGLSMDVLDWPAGAGKGIDDVYRAGRSSEIVRHDSTDAWDLVLRTLHETKTPPRPDTLTRVSDAARDTYVPRPVEEPADEAMKWLDGDSDNIDWMSVVLRPDEDESADAGEPDRRGELAGAEREPAVETPTSLEGGGGLLDALRMAEGADGSAPVPPKGKRATTGGGGAGGGGGGRKKKAPTPFDPPQFERGDEVELAERLMQQLQQGEVTVKNISVDRVRRAVSPEPVIYDRNHFWRFDPTDSLWHKLDDQEVFLQIASYAGMSALGDDGEPSPLKLSRSKIGGTIEIAKQMAIQNARAIDPKPAFFDNAPRGVALQDVFLRIDERTGCVTEEPLAARHRQTVTLPFKWDRDADRYATKWQTFYEEIFANCALEEQSLRANALDEIVGACLFGIATRFEKGFLLLGDGANGKSTWQKVIRALFPEEYVCSISPQAMAERFAMSALVGKRINLVAEMPNKTIMESNLIKSVFTGDELQVEYKGKDFMQFVPQAGHLANVNALPRTTDVTHGFMRRYVIVGFEMNFSGSPTRRVNYHEEIIATELPGIFARCVKAVQRLIRRGGYEPPIFSHEAIEEWKSDSDQGLNFVRQCLVKDANAETKISLLYAAYKRWSEQTGHKVMSETALAKSLREGGHKKELKNGNVYRLAIRPTGPVGTMAKRAGAPT